MLTLRDMIRDDPWLKAFVLKKRKELAADFRKIRAVDPALARRWYKSCKTDACADNADLLAVGRIIGPALLQVLSYKN